MSIPAKEKVAVFACNDLTGLLILNRIIPGIKEIGFQPVIFHTGDHRNRQFKTPTPPIVSFFNTKLTRDFIIPVLEKYPANNIERNCTFRQLATLHDLEYHEIQDVNDPEFISTIEHDKAFRGGIAARFLQVFNHDIISIFHEKGFLWNLHSGLLPNYKGLLLPFRAIDNGDKTYGMTLHDLTSGIDEGDIIQIRELALNRERPILDLYMDMVPTGSKMILSSLENYQETGQVKSIPQPNAIARAYYTNPTAQEFRDFLSKGIVYADPYYAIERIVDLFTVENTDLHVELKRALLTAISDAVSVPSLSSEELKKQPLAG